MPMGEPVAIFSSFEDARPSFARIPKSGSLLPYREGKAASTFTVIGSSACSAFEVCDSNGFNVLKIPENSEANFKVPSAKVFAGTLKQREACLA
jgi:hypothetical protein